MILLIDNYDSFSYNLYQLIGSVDPDIQVVRNDEIRWKKSRNEAGSHHPFPGPGRPEDAGICIPVIRDFAGKIPILGVCLGHQASAKPLEERSFLCKRADARKADEIHQLTGQCPVSRTAGKFPAARYHSWQQKKNCRKNWL